MLQFTKEVDYGLQLVITLAKGSRGDLLSLRTFSKDTGISFLFLQRIAKKLKDANIIEATKGAQGGYMLKKNPLKITLKEIIEALEGDYAIIHCLRGKCGCKREKKCESRKVFKKINTHLTDYLEKTKLADFV
ncbi:MAG: Rrf2 family transcriptional regulator [Candidatus Magasanikbacteria bacterium]|jgi:Rrf2 family protein|nr:Rrf2 family transcriptional regulator [Candidatus Magasanikbacteria bacterium]MBT4315309.1 Rrf2 family transcriptional regulator [Candidatus Magasanikbacteria bacterium]MBT4547181.1 Rrf2 family transcriptional regulator [Candidatus Magasanikbacteria bacterium]MBT6819679.1 Rrf2 family transcriptional regulator [Candidatus Magasanikbacteria bacterium]